MQASPQEASGELAPSILTILNCLLYTSGLTREDDMLPPRLLNEPVTSGPSKGKVTELITMLDEYYQVRGWDEYGVPTEDKLNELSLSSRGLAEAY